MKLRFLLLLLVTLAFASIATAQCATCIQGICQVTSGPTCTRTCCINGPGGPCPNVERTLECPTRVAVVPANYFTTDAPLRTEGSALRVQYTKPQPVKLRCATGTLTAQVL